MFLACLIRLYKISNDELNSPKLSDCFCWPKQELIQYLLDTFTEMTKISSGPHYKITPPMKDKILSYILCLKLRINNFALDPHGIASDLGLSVTKVCKNAKEIGARVESKRDEGVSKKKILLVLPIVFPTRNRQY